MEFIRRNFALKASAVVIAVVLWFTFNHLGATQPVSTKTLELPLAVHGIQAGFVPSVPVKTVTVEFAGPRSQLDGLAPEQFNAFVDCANKPQGLYSLQVAIVGQGSNQIKSIAPAQVVVTIDRYAFRSVPVVAENLPSGRPPQVTFAPKTVTVAGAQALVVQVMTASVSVPPTVDTKGAATAAKPVPMDAKLNPVNGVSVAPQFVRIISAAKKPATSQ